MSLSLIEKVNQAKISQEPYPALAGSLKSSVISKRSVAVPTAAVTSNARERSSLYAPGYLPTLDMTGAEGIK
jgi:hypothetical protein